MPPLPSAPPPQSPLARYRLLSPTAAVKVSPFALGAMNFGNQWSEWLGECDQATSESILDFYYEQGGNFIDTSNNYQFQESEKWIGEWMKKRENRDQIVLSTKFTTNYMAGPHAPKTMINFTGNGSKSLHTSIQSSLRNLQTDYIDVLFVHWWDYSTSIPELMQSLNHLVSAGKVLYLGISDAPAWVVSKANEYARAHGLRQFSVYQGLYSAATRDLEREIMPMCRAEGMGITPWGALGGGKFKTEAQRSAGGRQVKLTEKDINVSKVLESIANRKNTSITSVAMAYALQKTAYVFPILGGRKIEHLKGNIEALTLELTKDDIKEIEGAYNFDLGFPNNMLWGTEIPEHETQVGFIGMGGAYDPVPNPKPISPAKSGE